MSPLKGTDVVDRLWPILESLRKRSPGACVAGQRMGNLSLSEDLGFDSVEALQLILKIEESFGIAVPDEYLRRECFETVDTIATLIVEIQSGKKAKT